MAAQSVYPGLFEDKMVVKSVVKTAAVPFKLNDVRLLPSRFRDNMRRDSAWLMRIPVQTLVHSFQVTAGVPSGKEGGYFTVKKLGGWESLDCELRGHITGHTLSALALMYAQTGGEPFRAKGDSILKALRVVQQSYGNGYLSAFPEELINRNMRGQSVWAPWYTLHKILSGLIDQYLYADNALALAMAKDMGNWAAAKLSGVDDAQRRKMIRNEFGGINESFYNLYAMTGDKRYEKVAKFFYHNEVIDPLKAGKDDFGTKHTNTFIPKVLAEARNYELSGDADSRRAAEFFWRTMMNGHIFVTGCSSDKEHFFDPKQFSKHISGYTGETCCTYNMLKLNRHLFTWTADERLAEYYERALFNQIMGQQDPATGMVHYFQPLLSGAFKLYSTPDSSYWCCVGSGFENHAKYCEGIYYHNENGLYVNLFIPSTVHWKEKGISLRQETDFPNNGRVVFTVSVERPVAAALYVRVPSWSARATIKLNGKKIKVSSENKGSYVAISRKWNDGDTVVADYQMDLHTETAYGDKSRAALLYGPIVLAGDMGSKGIEAPAPFSDPKKYNDYYTYDFHVPADLPKSMSLDIGNASKTIKPAGGPLRFKSSEGYDIRPLYDITRSRYVVYWGVKK